MIGNQTDPDTTNNSAVVDTNVSTEADLSITKEADLDTVVAGKQLTYTIAVTNNGPSKATRVKVVDILPANVSFVSASDDCSEAGGTVTCSLGRLRVGKSKEVIIVVGVDPTAASIVNTASVSGKQTDPDDTNNSATVNTDVSAEADLSVTKEADLDTVVAGEPLIYTVAVTNNGPSDATGVVVTDTLPAGVSFASASAGCIEADGIVTCDIGSLSNGTSTKVIIEVTVGFLTTGIITNRVDVSGNETDINPDDNSGVKDTALVPNPACILELGFSYTDGTLTMDFNLGASESATWGMWLFIPGTGIVPLWSIPILVVDPPVSFPFSIPGFPSMGMIGGITVLNPPGATPCVAFDFADTGQPLSTGLAVAELQKLIANPVDTMPRIGESRR